MAREIHENPLTSTPRFTTRNSLSGWLCSSRSRNSSSPRLEFEQSFPNGAATGSKKMQYNEGPYIYMCIHIHTNVVYMYMIVYANLYIYIYNYICIKLIETLDFQGTSPSQWHNLGPSHVPPCVAGNASEVLGFPSQCQWCQCHQRGIWSKTGWWFFATPLKNISQLPSGYVKIAIENGDL